MMEVFDIKVDQGPPELYDGNDAYARLRLESDDDRKVFSPLFNGAPIDVTSWRPFKVIRTPEGSPENLTKPLGDRAAIEARYDPMVLSRKALDALLPHIGHLGQVLPLTFDECEYFFFNITNVIDAVDLDASEIVRYPDGGLSRIKRYAFKPQAVRDQLLFKIPQRPKLFAFCTDRFVKLVQDAKLTGFGFEKVWSDEATNAKQAA
jgi:hypothetical protein